MKPRTILYEDPLYALCIHSFSPLFRLILLQYRSTVCVAIEKELNFRDENETSFYLWLHLLLVKTPVETVKLRCIGSVYVMAKILLFPVLPHRRENFVEFSVL